MNTSLIRTEILTILRRSQEWDVIVIGGGATGLGAAVEAASRGYRTLLLEKYDFAKGTSSRSTKLIHGGVRYLAQGNLALVQEALHERGLLRQNAPHLVQGRSFVVPAYSWWSPFYYGAGLKLYDWLSGNLSFGPSRFLGKAATLEQIPTLKPTGLQGSILYHDGQFDDARLAIALLRTLVDQGGVALNYAPVVDLLKSGDRVRGVRLRDAETGEVLDLTGTAVINATGVFVDRVRHLDDPTTPNLLSPSQGVHLVVDRRFVPGDSALMIPQTIDGRVLFAVPWHEKVLLGTTDTPVAQPDDEPRPFASEIEFILQTAAQYLDPAPTRSDVRSVFVGQRPLVKTTPDQATPVKTTLGKGKATRSTSTAALSREHTIEISQSGLLTITGGKWTTYRRMGEAIVDHAVQSAHLPPSPSVTSTLKLHGWTQNHGTQNHQAQPQNHQAQHSKTEPPIAPSPHLGNLEVYGSDAPSLQQLPGADRLLHPRLPYLEAEVRWAARYEMARTVEDVLARRTRSLFLDATASLEAAPRVAAILAEELGYSSSQQHQQVMSYQTIATGYKMS